jgi:hypothetical protein
MMLALRKFWEWDNYKRKNNRTIPYHLSVREKILKELNDVVKKLKKR